MNLILKQNITEIGNDIISIDETGIVLKRKNDYAWSTGGKNVYTINLIIIMNQVTQYIGQSVWIVTFDRLIRGTYNGRKYRNFLFNKVIGKTNNQGILMDNASIHKTKKIKEELSTKKIKVIYNVPYHPESDSN